MDKEEKFLEIFAQLRGLMLKDAPDLIIHKDTEDELSLNTPFNPFRKQDHYFGGVNIKKNYVSFHLMAVYTHTELLEEIPETLKKRMQGKSCFNFKKVDEGLFEELAELVQKCYAKYQEAGYIGKE